MDCKKFKAEWVEAGLSLGALGNSAREHLGRCEDCRRLLEAEERLLSLMRTMDHPGSRDQQAAVLAIVAEQEHRRRRWALLPIFSSMVVLLSGILSWGGVPGSHLISDSPKMTLQTASSLLSSLGTALHAGARAAAAASSLLPGLVEIMSALMALLALGGSVALYHRWKQRWTLHF